MKKISIITSFLIVWISDDLQAQFAQIELFSGLDKTDFTIYSSYTINESKTLSINTLAFFQKFHNEENQDFDEIGVQPTLFWNIHKNVGVGPSIYYNSFAGFSERLSAYITFKNSRFLFVAIPTIAYSEEKDASYTEAFLQFQYNTPINDNLSLWLNGQFVTIWDKFKTHSRSYQQLRAGALWKEHQFGIGFDFDQYGTDPKEVTSFGVYYRKTL